MCLCIWSMDSRVLHSSGSPLTLLLLTFIFIHMYVYIINTQTYIQIFLMHKFVSLSICVNMYVCRHLISVWRSQKYVDTYLYSFCLLYTHFSLKRYYFVTDVAACRNIKNCTKWSIISLKIKRSLVSAILNIFCATYRYICDYCFHCCRDLCMGLSQ